MRNLMKSETMQKRFSFERAALLLRNRALDDLPTVLVAVGVIVALNLLAIVLGHAPFLNDISGHGTTWSLIVPLGGILLASIAFTRMHDGRSGPEWLLLPASSAEKYLSATATYLVVYPIVASVLAVVLSAVLALAGNLAGTGGGKIWNPIDAISLDGLASYLSIILVVLAGSARFRKLALGKTAAIAAGWTLCLTALFILALTLLSPDLRPSLFNMNKEFGSDNGFNFTMNMALSPAKESALQLIAEVLRWASVLFAASYGFALVTEKEARDEVQ